MSKDYLSFHAVRPWDSVERSEDYPAHYRSGGDTQEQIECCLSCPMASCNNCMEGKRKGQLPEVRGMKEAAPKKSGKRGDPCTDCNAKLLCQANGWTCNAKARWEEKHG